MFIPGVGATVVVVVVVRLRSGLDEAGGTLGLRICNLSFSLKLLTLSDE